MTRRAFLRNLLGAAAVLAVPVGVLASPESWRKRRIEAVFFGQRAWDPRELIRCMVLSGKAKTHAEYLGARQESGA